MGIASIIIKLASESQSLPLPSQKGLSFLLCVMLKRRALKRRATPRGKARVRPFAFTGNYETDAGCAGLR
jgi:hypothetical protein